MAENRAQSLRSMGVTQLRKVAASRGIKGLSKADKPTVIAAIRRESQPRPMDPGRRVIAYANQTGRSMFTARQNRRIRKVENRAKYRRVLAAFDEMIADAKASA